MTSVSHCHQHIFLHVDKYNKVDLKGFLGEDLIGTSPANKVVIVAGVIGRAEEVRCSQPIDITHMSAKDSNPDSDQFI